MTFSLVTAVLKRIWDWVTGNWRIVLIAAAIAVTAYLVVPPIYSWLNPPPKLNENQIQRGEAAKKAGNDAELRQILVESDAAEAAAVERNVNSKADTVNAIYESRKKWESATREEIQAEFDRRRPQ